MKPIITFLLPTFATAGLLRGTGPRTSAARDLEYVSSPCTRAADYVCFLQGWPSCCLNEGEFCPEVPPPCDPARLLTIESTDTSASSGTVMVGTSYCTNAPDYSCYPQHGWPSCCLNETEKCPEQRPPCVDTTVAANSPLTLGSTTRDSGSSSGIVGTSYCTYSPDYSCYAGGWPSCCFSNSEACPAELPPCDADNSTIVGTSYCTYSPDYTCHPEGWPSCCLNGNETCPETRPNCTLVETPHSPTPYSAATNNNTMTGATYCTYSPDYSCYPDGGWPSCCLNGNEACPATKPSCTNVTLVDMPSSSAPGNMIVGASYCTYSPDYSCYPGGWPSCCLNDNETCPETRPNCTLAFTPPILPSSASNSDSSGSIVIVGTSYCTYSPDYTCYPGGWPSCCLNYNVTCPETRPSCTLVDTPHNTPYSANNSSNIKFATSYCTYSPDYSCYPAGGWPSCCLNDNETCPETRPPCSNATSLSMPTSEGSSNETMAGASYCTYSPDYSCYPEGGWPACCLSISETCPQEKPGCSNSSSITSLTLATTTSGSMTGTSYCTNSPDYSCYEHGWPSCCVEGGSASCPIEKPACESSEPGSSYCTDAPDYICYREGRPECCLDDPKACPAEKPGCDFQH